MFPWWIKYPNVNNEIQNLDWLMYTVKHLSKEVKEFINLNTIKYADPILWNITSQYEANTVVVDGQTGNAYISTKAVPSGVHLNRTEYWTQIYNYADALGDLRSQIAFDEGNTTTASKPFAEDDLVFVNDLLYRVIAPMIAGDSFVVDSNIVKTTVEDELKRLAAEDAAIAHLIEVEAGIREAADTLLQTNIDNLKKDIIEVINLKEEGLDATYTNDNSALLASIISDAAPGSTLYFPKGKYLFNAPIVLNKQLNIIGDGIESILVFADDGIKMNTDRCNVKDLLLLPLSNTGTGLYCEGDFCRIENIFLRDNGTTGTVYWKNSIHLYDPWYTLVSNVQINDYKASNYRNGVGIRCSACVNTLLENIYIGFKEYGIVCDTTSVNSHACDGVQIEQGNIVVCDQGMNIQAGSNFILNNLLMDQIYDYCYNVTHAGYLYVNDSYIAILSASTPSNTSRIVYGNDVQHVHFNNCSFRGDAVLDVGLAFYYSTGVNINGGDIHNLTNAITFFDDQTDTGNLKITNVSFVNVTGNSLNASKCDLVVSGNVDMNNILTASNVIPINRTASITHVETINGVVNSYYYFDVPLACGWTPRFAAVQVPAINKMLITQVRSLNANRVQIQLYGDAAIGDLGDVTFKILLFA